MTRDNSCHTIDKSHEGVVEIYELVLNGNIQRFPANFFSSNGIIDKANTCIPIIKYLFEEKLKWNKDEICKYLTRKTFREYALGGMLTHYFNDSPYEILNLAYPNKFQPWELKGCKRNYWNNENAIKAVKWLIEEKLHLSREEVCKNICTQTFRENGLGRYVKNMF